MRQLLGIALRWMAVSGVVAYLCGVFLAGAHRKERVDFAYPDAQQD